MQAVEHRFAADDLVGGHLALNLANTVTARDTTPRDWLADFAVACDWAVLTGAFRNVELLQLRKYAVLRPREAANALGRLRDLRECVHDVAAALANGSTPHATVVARLGTHWKSATAAASFAVQPAPHPAWTFASSGLDLLRHVVAWHAVAFLDSEALPRTRICDGHDCGWLFVDSSKSGRRRWCDMKTCGNLAKARRHLRRLRTPTIAQPKPPPIPMSRCRMPNHSMPLHVRVAISVAILLCFIATTAGLADDMRARRWTPPGIASDQYESSPSFAPDGHEMLFMRSDRNFQNYRILWSRCEQDAWTLPQDAPFSAPRPALEADPFMTADGKRVYYVSSRHDATNEDLDIWAVDRKPDGSWAHPQRLPAPVNSASSELLPRLAADGRLYFGSSRPGGFGHGDIYVATPGAEDGSWRVDNLGPPVSTAANEYEADISSDGRTLIVVADRGNRSHLYHYTRQGERWVERGRIAARPDVFQVGPLLSPGADRLLFSQQDGESDRSGEIFLIDLAAVPDERWPPRCGGASGR